MYQYENPGGYGGYVGQEGQDLDFNLYHAGGGDQTQGGHKSYFSGSAKCESSKGAFLQGGDAKDCWGASSGGGGAGYYGGGGGVDVGRGGGGSSYVRKDLKHPTFLNGSQTFKSPSGPLEQGHSGDGFIIIQSILVSYAKEIYYKIFIRQFIILN